MKTIKANNTETRIEEGTSMNSLNFNLFRKMIQLKFFLVFIIVAAVLFSFSTDASPRELVFGLETSPERLIPIKIKNPQTFPVSMQIFEGLFDINEQGDVIPRIIEHWETKDYRTWLFHVRKGVYFHRSPIFKNGTREVTAKDVLYSLTRFCSAESYSSFLLIDYIKGAREYNQGKADRVMGLKLLDSYTVQVELVQPVPFFINHISTPVLCVYPEETDKKDYAEKSGLLMAVGTGPYIFTSMTDTEIVLEKNDHYWDSQNKPHLAKILFRVIKNDTTRLTNLMRGNIDMMVLPSSMFSTVFEKDGTLKNKFRKNYQIKQVATFNSHCIGINNKAISDVNLRRAMFWGTDRKGMINSILNGYADETGGTVPPGMNDYQPPFGENLFNPEKATAYLSKSSYKGDPIELLLYDIGNNEQIGQIFQAQMSQIGINIILKKLDYNSVISRMVKGETQLFSMFFEYAFSSPEPVLINLFSKSKIPVPNFFQFSNPSVDEMLKSLYQMKDVRKSVKFCAKIEAKVMEDVPAIFLYRQKYVVIYPRNLTGLEVSGNNHFFLEKVRISK